MRDPRALRRPALGRLPAAVVDFSDIEKLQHSGQWDQAGARLAQEARSLDAAGAELLVLCTNTMHKVADAITDAVDVPLVHIADATADAVHAQHLHTVGLIATAYTMEQDFYAGRLRDRHGLNVLVPGPEDRRVIHNVIYDELCMGIVTESSRDQYRRSCANSSTTEPRASCSAAPKSTCSSDQTTHQCRYSTPPACTSKRRYSSRWANQRTGHRCQDWSPQGRL